MASYQDFLPAVQSGGGWQRPSDWLALPTVTSAEQKFVGLHAVFPDGDNVCALLLTTSAGQYEVDWGDGTVTLYNSNVKAEHQYDYSTISASTDCSRGYRQVLVTVTPVSGNILTINFQQRYTGRNQIYSTGWLDVIGSFPNASSGQSITFGGASSVRQAMVEQVTWVTIGSTTNVSSMFAGCIAMRSIPLFNTASVTTFDSMHNECFAIQTLPTYNLSAALSIAGFFQNCISIIEYPPLDTSNATNFNSMFRDTGSAPIPLYNMSNALQCISMFQNSRASSIPLLDTSKCTQMNTMFSGAANMTGIPALSTNAITPSAGVDFAANFAQATSSLARCQMVFARTVGFANAQMGTTALVEIFNNLVDRSATTSATITITSNWGAALLTAGERAIASSKNWTITG